MSTRGCVAVKEGKGWRGVYNHSDSYPTGLGKELWDYLHKSEIDLHQFTEGLLEYGDWQEYLNNGICEYCGKRAGQPCNISGLLIIIPGDKATKKDIRAYWNNMPWAPNDPERVALNIKQDIEILDNRRRTGYPDPEAKHHAHITKVDGQITNLDPDPLFIAWVYVIDPDRQVMTILAHKNDKITDGPIREEPILRADGFWDYGHCAYKHVLVAEVDLTGAEPDWEAKEAREE